MKFLILILTALIFLSYSARSEAHCQSPLFRNFVSEVQKHSFDPLSSSELVEHNHYSQTVSNTPKEIFSQHYHLIQRAERQVFLQTWRFDTNSLGAAYLKKALIDLAEKRKKANAKQPVKVWLLINTISLQGHEKAKNEFVEYVRENNLNSPFVHITMGFFKAKGLGANHVKNLIVDGKLAMVTGANHSYNFNSKNYLYDAGITMRGEIAHTMSKDFIQVWRTRFQNQNYPQLLSAVKSSSCQPTLFVRQKWQSRITQQPQSSSSNWGFIHAMEVAKKSIDIFTPNLNADAFQQAIINAIDRGIQVRIILSHRYIANLQSLPTRGGANASQVSVLFRAIKKYRPNMNVCQLLQIKWWSEDGVNKRSGTQANSHVKYMAVDDQISYFGSANMDNQSLVNSREIGLFIDNTNRAQQWKKHLFAPQFAKGIDVQECGGPAEPSPHTNKNN